MKCFRTRLASVALMGGLTLGLAPLAALPAVEPRAFDITAFGAKGDGATLNTDAIQRAADACHEAGGGVVRVPEGVFVTGSLRLKSGVVLRIEKDALLRGSPKIADYTVETAPLHWGAYWKFVNSQLRNCLIYAHNAERVGIEGEGTIDGQGGHERKVFPNAGDLRRPMLVRFERCRQVTLRGVTLLDPASFTAFFVRSEDIQIESVVIRSRNSPNGDGLDFDGCRRVRIRDCDLDTGDDAIGPKTFQPDAPNEDFEISGCRISARWAAVRIGAESIAPIRRLTVRDCRFTKCQAGIKIESSEGAMFEDLRFADIEMKDVCQPFMVLASRFAFSAHNTSARPPVGRIRRVRFENIRAEVRAAGNVGMVDKAADQDPFRRACSAVASHPDARIEDISFKSIDLILPGGGTAEHAARLDVGELLESTDYMKWAVPFDGELPASALYLRHVKGVRLEDVQLTLVKPDARALIAGDDVEGLTLRAVVARAPTALPGLVKLADLKDFTESDCRVECGKPAPVIAAPTAEELRRLAELRKRSAELECEYQKKASQGDTEAKKAPDSN